MQRRASRDVLIRGGQHPERPQSTACRYPRTATGSPPVACGFCATGALRWIVVTARPFNSYAVAVIFIQRRSLKAPISCGGTSLICIL
jgi:hypothetical protein